MLEEPKRFLNISFYKKLIRFKTIRLPDPIQGCHIKQKIGHHCLNVKFAW